MTSQAYNNNDVLLFLLQIWKQPRRIKCSDQFRVNKRDTDCFEYLHEENTKPLVNVSVWHAWIFLSTSDFIWFLQRGGKEWRNSNRIGEGCWYSCGYFLPLILVEKSVVQLRPSARRKHVERSYFSSMVSDTDLDLHLQFVCFLRNERLYIDRSNDYKYVLPTSKLTGNLSWWILSLS